MYTTEHIMRKRTIALLLVLVFLLTLCPFAFATTGDSCHHVWGPWSVVKNPTCTESATRYRICTLCGERQDEPLPRLYHDWSEWDVIREPQGTTPGLRERSCRRCGITEQKLLYPEGTIQTGDSGRVVRKIQESLHELGYLATRPDGQYGSNTETAVRKYQEEHGQEPTGVVMPALLEELCGSDFAVGIGSSSQHPEPAAPDGTPGDSTADTGDDSAPDDKPDDTPDDNPDDTPDDSALPAPIPDENIAITKSLLNAPADPTGFALGEYVQYCISLENLSSIPLLDVELRDVLMDVVLSSTPYLDAHGMLSATFTYTVGAEDVNRGYLESYASGSWRDSVTGQSGVGQSNTVRVPVIGNRESAVTVVSTVTGHPLNGSYYTPGETIAYDVTVRNTGETTITDGTVRDSLYPGSGVIAAVDLLAPGESRSYAVEHIVDYDDARAGTLENTVSFTGTAENGDEVRADNTVNGRTGYSFPCVRLDKEETSDPASHSYYANNEQIDYSVRLINIGSETATLDVFDETDEGIVMLSRGLVLFPGESIRFSCSVEVGSVDVDNGYVRSCTYAFITYADSGNDFACDEVYSPVGKPFESPVFHGGSGADCCVRRVVGGTGASLSSSLDLCAEHAALAATLDKLAEEPGMTEEKLAATVLAAWNAALAAQFDLLAGHGNESFAVQVGGMARAYTAWTDALRAALLQCGADETQVNRLLAERAALICAQVCYLNGSRDAARPDSYIGAPYEAAASAVAVCGQTLNAEGEHIAIEETRCAAHGALESALLEALQGGAPRLAFTEARRAWMNAMNAQNKALLERDSELSGVITQERAAFGKLLCAEEQVLNAIYPDAPATVEELLVQRVRAHVTDTCALLGGAVATAEPPAETPKAPIEAASDDAALFGIWYLNTLDVDGTAVSAADMGMHMTLVLREDGNASSEGMDAQAEGTWSVEGETVTLTLGEDAADFRYTGSELSAEQDGLVLHFTREEPTAGYSPAAARDAADAVEFEGVWTPFLISADGVSIPVDLLEQSGSLEEAIGLPDLNLAIEDGSVRFAGQEPAPGEIAGGALHFSFGRIDMSLRLLEDGALCLDAAAFAIYYR